MNFQVVCDFSLFNVFILRFARVDDDMIVQWLSLWYVGHPRETRPPVKQFTYMESQVGGTLHGVSFRKVTLQLPFHSSLY